MLMTTGFAVSALLAGCVATPAGIALEPHGKPRAEALRIRVIEKGDLLGLPAHLRNLLTRNR